MNYRGTNKKTLYHGNGKPRERYRNQTKIAGYHAETKTGESVTLDDTYNDTADVELLGNTVQASDYYAKDGLSSQAGTPTPDAPIPITSNLAAGTYKYTSTDGIYEFILDDDLRGLGTALDKVVFDRKSHRGISERRNARKILNGTEAWYAFQNDGIVFQYALKDWSSRLDSDHIYRTFSWYKCSHATEINETPLSMPVGKFATNNRDNVCWIVLSTIATTVSAFKAWLALNPVTVVYQLATPARTTLTFTKVASSTATEVPMAFLANTPSLDYPADVVDAQGNVMSNGAIVGAMPALRKVGTISDSHVMRTGAKTKRIEKIASYAGESITTPYLSTTGALTTGATVLYQLATPVTEQYTPMPVPTHLGQTIISTDSVVKPTITATAKVPD